MHSRAEVPAINAESLAQHYSAFRVTERILLTGHSHQAWPDVAQDGHMQAWADAAAYVDDKWKHAYAKAEEVRDGFRSLLGDTDGHYALASSTHDLLVRFLSALPLGKRPRVVTTDGEFHSARRQLDRLCEENIEVVKVPCNPADDIAEALANKIDDRTAAVIVSAVLFESAHIVPNLGAVQEACQKHGAQLLVDAYHALNVVPFDLFDWQLDQSFVLGGGYKYCQLGEGNCFLRFPKDCALRPVVTGWFSEFSALADEKRPGQVAYGTGGDRFAGSTYDPTSHYRAASVFAFFRNQELTVERLRAHSQRQIALLAKTFDEADLPPDVICRDRETPLHKLGGFLSLRAKQAGNFAQALRKHNVWTDARGEYLRLGPAPYCTDTQLVDGIAALSAVVKEQ